MARLLFSGWLWISSIVAFGQPADLRLDKAAGTGRTYGSVMRLTVTNTSQSFQEYVLPAMYIPSRSGYQPYIIPFTTSVSVGAGESADVELFGYCLNPHQPALAAGKHPAGFDRWVFVTEKWEPQQPATQDLIPAHAPCIPGGAAINHLHDIIWAEHAPMLVAYASLLHDFSMNISYTPEGIPAAEIVQHSLWQVLSSMSGYSWTYEQATQYWLNLIGGNSNIIGSLDYPMATSTVWESATMLSHEWLCHPEVQIPPHSQPLTTERLEVFTGASSSSDRTTSSTPKVPVPPVPPAPPVPPVPPVPPGNGCVPHYSMSPFPAMDGGLNVRSVGEFVIGINDFLPLVAEGADADEFHFSCLPDENCPESTSRRREGLTSRVRYVWEIIDGPEMVRDGPNTFVPFTFEDDAPVYPTVSARKAVLWDPPAMENIPAGKDSSVVTKMRLTISDDLPGQPIDLDVIRDITITTSRRASLSKDSLHIKVEAATFDTYKQPDPFLEEGTCMTSPLAWSKTDDIQPLVAQGKPLIYSGDRIILSAEDIRDPDVLKLNCSSNCENPEIELTLEDEVIYEWRFISTCGKHGYFLEGEDWQVCNTWGRHIVFEAPILKADESRRQVYIEVRAYNQPRYPFIYNRTPVLGKADDLIAIDTLHIQVDCKPPGPRPSSMVVIGWHDEFKDHDDPWMVETLRDVSKTVIVDIAPDECEPKLRLRYAHGKSDLGLTGVIPDSTDHNHQTDDHYLHETVCFEAGNFFFLLDAGIMLDDGFLKLPTDSEVVEFVKFQEEIFTLITFASLFPRLVALVQANADQEGIYKALSNYMLTLIDTGDIPVTDPFFQLMIQDYMANHPGVPFDVAVQNLKNEIPIYRKGWQNNKFAKDYDIGLIYSWWVIISEPTNCKDSCPVLTDHYTFSSLGDSDHYYKRTSKVIVTTYPNGQPFHQTYSYSHENKGADFE